MGVALKMNNQAFTGQLLFNEPMAKHTSWRAGGNAKQYYIAENIDDLASFLQSLAEDEDIFWLGLGSNTLVRDGGFDGTVIAMQGVATDIKLIDEEHVEVGASVSCAKLAKFCVKNKNSRRGRNPATGEDLLLGSKRVVTFKCSPVLRDKMNGEE